MFLPRVRTSLDLVSGLVRLLVAEGRTEVGVDRDGDVGVVGENVGDATDELAVLRTERNPNVTLTVGISPPTTFSVLYLKPWKKVLCVDLPKNQIDNCILYCRNKTYSRHWSNFFCMSCLPFLHPLKLRLHSVNGHPSGMMKSVPR